MRTLMLGLAALVAVTGCRGEEEQEQLNEEELAEVTEAFRRYQDVTLAIQDGWVDTMVYAVHPELGGMGVHYVDPSKAPDSEPTMMEPNTMFYHNDEDGNYVLAGLEWYQEGEFDEAPKMFGVSFDGPMEGHNEFQGTHYDLHAWVYIPLPEDIEAERGGPFSEFNPNLTPPSWRSMAEGAFFSNIQFSNPADAMAAGFADAGCESGAEGATGMALRDDSRINSMDPTLPDTIFYGFGYNEAVGQPTDQIVGFQWTVPASEVTGTPELFPGHPFMGPDANDDYYFRVWLGGVAPNPLGYFAELNPNLSCTPG